MTWENGTMARNRTWLRSKPAWLNMMARLEYAIRPQNVGRLATGLTMLNDIFASLDSTILACSMNDGGAHELYNLARKALRRLNLAVIWLGVLRVALRIGSFAWLESTTKFCCLSLDWSLWKPTTKFWLSVKERTRSQKELKKTDRHRKVEQSNEGYVLWCSIPTIWYEDGHKEPNSNGKHTLVPNRQQTIYRDIALVCVPLHLHTLSTTTSAFARSPFCTCWCWCYCLVG